MAAEVNAIYAVVNKKKDRSVFKQENTVRTSSYAESEKKNSFDALDEEPTVFEQKLTVKPSSEKKSSLDALYEEPSNKIPMVAISSSEKEKTRTPLNEQVVGKAIVIESPIKSGDNI